jgi:hypothetical protein
MAHVIQTLAVIGLLFAPPPAQRSLKQPRRSSPSGAPTEGERPPELADIVIPEVFAGSSLSVDGEAVQIVDAQGMAWVSNLDRLASGPPVVIVPGHRRPTRPRT